MKSKSLFLVVTFLLSSLSSAYQISFLKTEEFKKLPQEKKIQYLNGLQKIMVGMSKLSPYMADADQQADSRRPARKDDFENWEISPPSSATVDPAVQAAVTAAPVAASAPAPRASAPTPAPTPAPVPSAPAYQPKARLPQPPLETANQPVAAAARPAVAPVRQSVEASRPTLQPVKPPENKPVTGSDSQFRCMHSGFVIEKDPCRGHRKIPKWMGIDGMSENNKSCGPGFSVCNPVIFGLKLSNGCDFFLQEGCSLKAKPFCAQSTLWPTEECHKMATDNQNRGTIVAAEIRSEVKPQLFERFEQQFNSLCNPDNIKKNPHAEMKNGKPRSDKSAQAVRDDITKTCRWAQKQTNLLNESFADLNSGGDFYPHKKKQKGSK